jgi:hypothetical protein
MPDLTVNSATRAGTQVTLTGKAASNALVEVFAGATLLGSKNASNTGTWTITVTAPDAPLTVKASGKEADPPVTVPGIPTPVVPEST